MAKHEPVLFEFPDPENPGEVIHKSNDPYWNAEQLVKSRGTGDDDEIPDEYEDLNGKQLKAKAEEEGVDITGLKTVGEVRAKLREEAAARAAQD